MLKAITLLKRKNNFTVEEFQNYWMHNHVEVIKRLPGVHRYVQNHPLPVNYARGTPVCDGVAELWAENSTAFREMASSDVYPEVLKDEEEFVDRTSINLILTSEITLLNGRVSPAGIKKIRFIHHHPDMDIDQFQRYWRNVHGPEVIKLHGLKRYTQSHARPGGYKTEHTPAYDGLSCLWFNSLADLQQAMNSNLYADIMEDEMNFISTGDNPSLTCSEHIIID